LQGRRAWAEGGRAYCNGTAGLPNAALLRQARLQAAEQRGAELQAAERARAEDVRVAERRAAAAAAAADAARRAADDQRLRAWVQHAALVASARGAVAHARALLQRLDFSAEDGPVGAGAAAPAPAAGAVEGVADGLGLGLGLGFADPSPQGEVAEEALLDDEEVDWEVQEALRAAGAAANGAGRAALLRQRAAAAAAAPDPHAGEAARLDVLAGEEAAAGAAAAKALARASAAAACLAELDAAFGRTGVQSFALEGVLGDLQARAGRFLAQLSTGFALSLSAHRAPAAGGRGGGGEAIERITKSVWVQPAAGGAPGADAVAPVERSLRQLSGGERRRVALALALGFSELVAARGRLRCNLIVLDEARLILK